MDNAVGGESEEMEEMRRGRVGEQRRVRKAVGENSRKGREEEVERRRVAEGRVEESGGG